MATNYDYFAASAIPLLSGSTIPGSPHDGANRNQSGYGKGGQNYAKVRFVAYESFLAAGCRSSDATEMILGAENLNKLNGVIH